jgi:hypothetical protein
MFPMTVPAVMLSAVLIGQRPAVEMPGRTNAEILANCMSYLRSKSPEDRSFALSTMGLMGKDARGASRQLCAAFLDSAPQVRQAAALALPQVNRPLYQPITEILNAGDNQQAYEIRLRGIQQLQQLGAEGEPSIPIILNFMDKAQGPDRPKS